MVTPSTRNILVAFIASPGDVTEERQAAREVINELNKSLRTIEWQIDIIGWEDTSPGVGRPQEIINKDVDACHLFLGILWKWWGTPTGKYSSGFEEEFERALKRREETGSPEIWLFFKCIDPEFLKDKGGQLQKVLEFKQKQNERRRVLYQEFSDAAEWKRLLSKWLLEYVFKQINALQQPPETVSNVTAEAPDMGPSDAPLLTNAVDARPAHEQILGVMSSIRGAVEGAGPNDHTLGTSKLDPFDIIRCHLLSTALMALQIPGTILGVHEAQNLYLYRQRLEPVQVELTLLLQMLIVDDDGLIPGWYWLAWLDEESLKAVLFDSALRDRNANVRARAWDLLAAARILPVEDAATWDRYLKYMAADEPQVRKAGIKYLGAVGSMRDLPMIKSGLDDPSVSGEAVISRLLVLARNNPAQILSTEPIPRYLPEKRRVISELKANVGNIRSESLLKVLRTKEADEDVKYLAVEELKRKGGLTREVASSLLEGSTHKVAEVCYKLLIELGEKFPPEDIYINVSDSTYNRQYSRDFMARDSDYTDAKSVLLEMYKNYPEEDLWEVVDWQSDLGLGDVAYKALALYHFPSVAARVRDDLDEDFKSYEEPFIESAMSKWVERSKNSRTSYRREPGPSLLGLSLGITQSTRAEEDAPEVSAKKEAEGIKDKYIAAALAGIAKNGVVSDVVYGRKYLSRDDYDVRVEAVAVISKFGDEDDIENLMEVAKGAEGVLLESAARAALKLSPDVKKAANTMLLTVRADLASVVVSYLTNERDVAATAEFLEPFLKAKSDVVRMKVAAFFARKFKEEELKALLAHYTEQLPYYYDVVCWLDRIIYAPSRLKEAYTRQLENELIVDDPNI